MCGLETRWQQSQQSEEFTAMNSPHWLQFVMLMCCYQNRMCKLSNRFTQASVVVVHEKLGATYLMELCVLDGSLSMHFDNICYNECYK